MLDTLDKGGNVEAEEDSIFGQRMRDALRACEGKTIAEIFGWEDLDDSENERVENMRFHEPPYIPDSIFDQEEI